MLLDTKQLIRVITIFSCYSIICVTTDETPLKECIQQMYITNELINNIIPAARDLVLSSSIQQIDYEEMLFALMPPDLSKVDKNNIAFFNADNCDREKLLQKHIKKILSGSNFEIPKIDVTEIEDYVQGYDGERYIRIHMLLPPMMRVLHYTYGTQRMCDKGDDRKCQLVALIKSFKNPQKNFVKADCKFDPRVCVITELLPEADPETGKITKRYRYFDKEQFNIFAACYSTPPIYYLWMGD